MRLISLAYLAAACISTATAAKCRPSKSVSSSSVVPSPSVICVPGNLLPDSDDFDPTAYTTHFDNDVTFNTDCGTDYSTCVTVVDAGGSTFGLFSVAVQVPAQPHATFFFSVAIRVNNVATAAKLNIYGGNGASVDTEVDLSTFTVGEYQVVTLFNIPEDSYGSDIAYATIVLNTDEVADVTLAGFTMNQECAGDGGGATD